uniref:Dynein axonemal light chain 4 n=1 Tax=Papio anubis TaxID=9555 RepID=A0A8I5NXD3_PAPAN
MGETEGKKDEADYKRLQTFPLVRHSDMPEEMRVETMELCVTACEKFSNNNESAAKMIKETMDKKFGSSWHVVIGEGFGFEITHEVGDEIFHTGTHQSPLSRGLLSPCILGAPLPCHPQYSREVSAIFVVGGHIKMAPRRRRFFQGTQAASLLVLWGGADPAETPSPQLDPRLNRPLHLTGPAATQLPSLGRDQAAFPVPSSTRAVENQGLLCGSCYLAVS